MEIINAKVAFKKSTEIKTLRANQYLIYFSFCLATFVTDFEDFTGHLDV